MKILVFVKQVPDTDDVKLDPKTGNLMREGVESIMNPLDANAVETALRLKEKYGGTVVAISMGPPQADEVLKKALGMGCDESVLLSDRALGGADTLATGYPLAKAAEKIGEYDLLICGATPPTPRRLRPAPSSPPSWASRRSRSAARSRLRTVGPSARGSCPTAPRRSRSSSRPSSPSAPRPTSRATRPPINIMKALKKPRYTWNAEDLGCDPDMIGIPGSPSSNKRIFEPPKRNTDTKYFEGEPEAIAKAIADVLEAEHII